jgi:DNA-binding CsgD family transcriptional regulator
MGRIDEGLRVAEKAEATIAEQLWRDEITARRSGVLVATRGPRAAATAAEPLLRRAEGRALAWACLAASCSFGRLGRLEAALDAATKGHAAQLVLTRPLDWYPWMHIFFRGEALAYAGRLEDAEALATGQYEEGLAVGSTEMQAFFTWQLARVTVERGHVQTAARHAQESVTLFGQLGRPQVAQVGLVHLALALALGGRAEEATEALAAHDAIESPPPVFTQMDLFQARAWTAVATGDLPRARLLLDEAVIQGESTGDLVGEAAALHTLARLGYSKEATSRLAALTSEIQGDLVQARAAHAHALVGGDAEHLLRVSSAFEAMGADLLAAEAAADAAVALRRAGETRGALTAGRRAGVLVGLCEGAVTPALQVIETRAQLTPAERRVALLAAGGHPNREIADQLSLSVRTVENHLQRVYEKLGVTGRAQLANTFDVARDGPAASTTA